MNGNFLTTNIDEYYKQKHKRAVPYHWQCKNTKTLNEYLWLDGMHAVL